MIQKRNRLPPASSIEPFLKPLHQVRNDEKSSFHGNQLSKFSEKKQDNERQRNFKMFATNLASPYFSSRFPLPFRSRSNWIKSQSWAECSQSTSYEQINQFFKIALLGRYDRSFGGWKIRQFFGIQSKKTPGTANHPSTTEYPVSNIHLKAYSAVTNWFSKLTLIIDCLSSNQNRLWDHDKVDQ